MNKLSRGFTLFEILIVVVIIGLLATVLVASLDPLESIRKTNDTALITALTNIQNSFASYAANEGVMPWDDGDTTNCDDAGSIPAALNYGGTAITTPFNSGNISDQFGTTGCIRKIINSGYLKASIAGALNDSRQKRVYFSMVRDLTNGDKVIMCFRPESRDIKKQMNYGATINTYAPLNPSTANTLWCSF